MELKKEILVELKWLNNFLMNLNDLRDHSMYMKKDVVHEVKDEYQEKQGVEGEYYEIYRLPDVDRDLYLRLKITTDSYGSNETIGGLEFVEGVEKTITTYEPIN